jgi:hypothetical protein
MICWATLLYVPTHLLQARRLSQGGIEVASNRFPLIVAIVIDRSATSVTADRVPSFDAGRNAFGNTSLLHPAAVGAYAHLGVR